MPSTDPPDRLRLTASPSDAVELERLCGVRFLVEDLPSLLDPRGKHFQRLEWLGDSVLDVLLAQHRRTTPPCCRDQRLEDLCSDRVLTARAQEVGLASALDWHPSPGRLADVVEALVGAAWQVGAASAVRVAEALVHPGLTLSGVGLAAGEQAAGRFRPDAQLGSAVMEAACALLLLEEMPDADEGELSKQRGVELSGPVLASRAERAGLDGGRPGPVEVVADRIQAAVGRAAADEGVLPGLRLATRVLRPG